MVKPSSVQYIYIVFSTNASCRIWEKLIPFASALSFSHAGIVKVFFTDLLFLAKSISVYTNVG